MQANRSRRSAMSLIELLTVIAIITILAALTAIFFPRFQDQELVNRGADQLQGWLLAAKMQAKRDRLPTGLRMTVNIINQSALPTIVPLVEPSVSELHYIQQPDNYAQGFASSYDPTTKVVTFAGVTFLQVNIGANVIDVVLPGDYLEVYGGGLLHRIVAVNATGLGTLTLDPNTSPLPLPPPLTPVTSTSPPNYRIIPQPRMLAGEQSLKLPSNIAISFFVTPPSNPPPPIALSQSVPLVKQIFVPDPSDPINKKILSQNIYEVLFAPSGAVIGQGTGTGQIIFWVRDISKPIPGTPNLDLLVGKGTLITVQPRTGFIIAHPVAPGTDPYLFTRDSRSSGM